MTDTNSGAGPAAVGRPSRLGLSVPAIIALALLAVPRVILHDLGIVADGTPLNALLVFAPPLIWIMVALAAHVPKPFRTLLVVGLTYGALLAIGHQLLWGVSFADSPPQLGGNLADLDPGLQAVVLRTFAVISSIGTGALVGAVSGLVAWGVRTILTR